MKALSIDREMLRFGAARVASALRPGAGAKLGPLRLVEMDPLELPGHDWVRITPRLAGICGSDLATVDGRSSRWFEPIVSFPFVPGHEVVADDPDGRRVVVEPVLGCVARGIDPVCPACADGRLGNCGNLAHGHLEPGLQTGYCCDTGGGWATEMLAHPSQLHEVPDELDDTGAVLIEPTACAVHAALAAQVQPDETVAVIGAGTLGLLTIAALTRWSPPARLVVAAKHPHQRQWAQELTPPDGAAAVLCDPDQLARAVRRTVGTQMIDEAGAHVRLSQGADVTVDCVGSADSIADALAVTRPGGRVVLVGMPGVETLDLTPLWQREISLTGAYAYGTEVIDGQRHRTFDLAAELVAAAGLGRLVSATYALERADDALVHAGAAGRLGATKVAFAPGAAADAPVPDHPATPTLKGRR
jgi:threonine dehydrogenase-like Zn-dependent dehydrogenase